ncbi:MAG: type II CAAX endopeptidase family protein [Armatimonadota bacterium]|nr:CPBP family intramembrane metalloprotease [bacterium]MCS7310047.1 CPBP family intramembrane metalloprotease [Armatimonadota bacterium]MDW8104823.1 type II CAAX endopeptidase family protein [Armatimonadota bacterium]MDW8289474.1 type II CAAX endopeptidase family protein [Armatimonadota bacterium]
MNQPNPFLEVARQGRNEWWRYLAGFFIIFALLMMGQVVFALPLLLIGADRAGNELLLLTVILLSFVPGLVGVWIVVQFLHGRPFRTLITPYERIDWRRFAVGVGGWFVIAAASALIEALLYPGRYQPNPHPLSVLPFLLVAMLLIPIQAGTEELIYRGYLLQGMGLLFRQPLLLAITNGALFALPHAANPETAASFAKILLLYFLAGFFWTLITLRSGTLELAIGAHTANNLFTAIVANYQTTAIPSRSFFVIEVIDANYQLATIVVGMTLFYWLLAKRRQSAQSLTPSYSPEASSPGDGTSAEPSSP